MKIFQRSHALYAVICIAFAALCSCNRSDNALLGTIPADSQAVIILDMNKVLDNLGCKITKEGIEIPSELKGVRGMASLEEFGNVSSMVDTKNIVAFQYNGDMIVTALITEPEEFHAKMKSLAKESDESDGYTLYLYRSNTSVVVKGDQLWTARENVGTLMSNVNSLLEKAEKRPFLKNDGLAELLSRNTAVRFAVSSAVAGIPVPDTWLAGTIKLESNSSMATMHIMKPTGENIKLDMLKPLNNDFLRYVPGNFNYALAMGIAKPEEAAAYLNAAKKLMPMRERTMIEVLIPFINKIEGTVALAGELPNPYSLYSGTIPPFLVMAKMSQNDVNEAVNQLTVMARGMGARVSNAGSSIYLVEARGLKVYVGNVDGQLGISTVPFEDTRNNAFNTRFLSRLAAMAIDLPAGYGGVFSRPVNFTANVQEDEIQAEMTFPETEGKFLKTLVLSTTR